MCRPPLGADHDVRPLRARRSLALGLSWGVLGLTLTACSRPAASAPPRDAGAAPPGPVVRVLLPTSPGGAETCFNATDDNGNLLLDEGCDVRQGDVHFMVAWPDPSLDVDLLVVDPSGSLASATAPSTLGLVLSDDCPRAGGACSAQAFESVHLDADDVPVGTYHVRIVVQTGARARLERPLSVRFGARLKDATLAREIEFSADAREVTLAFSVADEARVASPRD